MPGNRILTENVFSEIFIDLIVNVRGKPEYKRFTKLTAKLCCVKDFNSHNV